MAPKLLALSLFAVLANAHQAVFHKAMYCLNGTVPGVVDYNSNAPVSPLWMLSTNDWWFHHVNQCDEFPPAPGDFLELPAGGSFTVEIAGNRGLTSLSYNGEHATAWGDGQNHPNNYNEVNCITNPNLHTQNQSMAAGTAFAISYESDISQVTMDNLAVFSVRHNTPWKRVTSYDVPQNMPACPPDGCTCAWVWIPNGCGEPNIYMEGLKCMVTNATSTTPIATPKAPVWCQEDQSACTQGAKQILVWNQAEGNNIVVNGTDESGRPKSPAYNSKCGFSDGAQNDIFATSSSSDVVQADRTVAIPSTTGGAVPPISSNTTSTSAAFSTSTSQAAGATGSPTSSLVCGIPPSSSTNIPVSTASINSSSTTTTSASAAFNTSTSQAAGATGSPTSSLVCSIPPSNPTNIPVSTAPINSSPTTTTSTLYIGSTFNASTSTFSSAYSAAPSNSTSNPLTSTTSTSSSDGDSSSTPATCRRTKRMVHKRNHQPLF